MLYMEFYQCLNFTSKGYLKIRPFATMYSNINLMYSTADSGSSHLGPSMLPHLAELLIAKTRLCREDKFGSRWCEQLIVRLATKVTFTLKFYPLNSSLKNNAGA